jgi:hypothetical protein
MNKYVLIFWLVLIGCSENNEPIIPIEVSSIPEITFDALDFIEGPEGFDPDTLRLSIFFQDGDLDLGLRNNERYEEPYQPFLTYLNVDGSGEFVQLKDRNSPEYDTLPPYEFPYYCLNYRLVNDDTIYVNPNPKHFNIYVKFFVEENGSFNEFDFETAFDPICSEGFNEAFPYLDPDIKTSNQWPVVIKDFSFKITVKNHYSGVLEYKMLSYGFDLLFKGKPLKIKCRIFDRSQNSSNWLDTPPIII